MSIIVLNIINELHSKLAISRIVNNPMSVCKSIDIVKFGFYDMLSLSELFSWRVFFLPTTVLDTVMRLVDLQMLQLSSARRFQMCKFVNDIPSPAANILSICKLWIQFFFLFCCLFPACGSKCQLLFWTSLMNYIPN